MYHLVCRYTMEEALYRRHVRLGPGMGLAQKHLLQLFKLDSHDEADSVTSGASVDTDSLARGDQAMGALIENASEYINRLEIHRTGQDTSTPLPVSRNA